MAKKKPINSADLDFTDLTKAVQGAIVAGFKQVGKSIRAEGADMGKVWSESFSESSDAFEDLEDSMNKVKRLHSEINKDAAIYQQVQGLQGKAAAQKLRDLGLESALTKDIIPKLEKGQFLNKQEKELITQTIVAKRKQNELEADTLELRMRYNKEAEEDKRKIREKITLLKSIAKDPALAKSIFAVEGIKAIKKELDKFGEGYKALREEGVAMEQAAQGMAKAIGPMAFLGLSDAKGVVQGMVAEYGSVNKLTKEQVQEVGHLAHQFGIAGKEAFELTSAFSRLPGQTKETAVETLKTVGNLAKAKGVAPGVILKEMAKNTEAMATYSKGGAENFAKAAIDLKKMGIELSSAVKMADGLLNFEDSINKQMEASVLLGREINLDKARELALNGDLKAATDEVLKNVGGQAEFDKMNVLQKRKLAEATGLTVEELQKTIKAQETYNKYHSEDATIWNKIIGYGMEYGGVVANFVKDYGLLVLSGGQMIIQGVRKLFMKRQENAAEIQSLSLERQKTVELTRQLAIKRQQAISGGSTGGGAAGGGAAGGGAAAAKGMKSLSSGVKSFASPKVFLGALGMVATAAGLIALLPGLPTLFLLAIPGIGQGFNLNMKGISRGLNTLANAATNIYVWAGIGLLAAFGASLIPLTFALSLLAPVIQAFGNIIVGVLAAVPPIISAIANAFVTMFTAVSQNIGTFMLLGPALMSVGAGLSMMAMGGLMAMPVIGALIALATVAPALVGLGNALGGVFGGGGGNKKEDKMDKLIAKLDKFTTAVINQQVVLKLDGTKVAESARLSTVTTGQR